MHAFTFFLFAATCVLSIVIGGADSSSFAAEQATSPHTPLVANLNAGKDHDTFKEIRDAFRKNNPGYDISYHSDVKSLTAESAHRVVFVQQTTKKDKPSKATITPAGNQSDIDVGDIILLRPEQAMTTDSAFGCLVFSVPEPFANHLPSFIRPDWDDQITDTPGGCATETGAYRRILLTWLETVGPYTYRALNAHRVRITDSFTHYHPVKRGFDEFYLVQMVQPKARIITSSSVDLIESPEKVTPEIAKTLLHETPLAVGDLVYLPRGLAHRGIDGVLAQVITTPGFRPGAEVGLDHALRAINERLGLKGNKALPFNKAASTQAVVK